MLVAVIKLYENSEYVQKYKKKSGKKEKTKTHYQIQGKLSVVQLSLKRINQDKYIKKNHTCSTEQILHKLYFNTECKVIKKCFPISILQKEVTNSLDKTDQCWPAVPPY